MDKLSILFLTKKGDSYVGAPSTYHGFEQAVGKQAECKWAGEGWSLHKPGELMDDTVSRLYGDEPPDWVIDNKNTFTPTPDRRDYRVGVFISDLHGKHSHGINTPLGFCQLINKCGYDAVFSKYMEIHGTSYDPKIFQRRIECAFHHLPWSVDTKRFKPKKKNIDATFIGAVSKSYPLRQAMWDDFYYTIRGYKGIRCESPKGKTFERDIETLTDEHYVGDKYAELLARTRILLFGSSKYRYPVQKYFEGAASGCLMLCDKPSTAKHLGLINCETFIEVNEGDWDEALVYILDNWAYYRKIVRASLKNTLMKHSHQVRASEFLEILDSE